MKEPLANALEHFRRIFYSVREWFACQGFGQAFGIRVTPPAVYVYLDGLMRVIIHEYVDGLTFDMPFLIHCVNNSSGSSSVP